jgi:hypothetical protein
MKYCIVSSLCEPIAAVVFGMFFNNYLTRYLMSALNAGGKFVPLLCCLQWAVQRGCREPCSSALCVPLPPPPHA